MGRHRWRNNREIKREREMEIERKIEGKDVDK